MRRSFFRILAQFNKKFLPSYSKKRIDLARTTKLQKALIGWKLWVTKNTLP